MKMSHVTLDRFLREEAAKNAVIRKQLASDGRCTRSSAEPMSDDELLDKLRELGFALDRDGIERLCQDVLSAEEAVQPLHRDWDRRASADSVESDWIWICVLTLWERWWPDKVCMELLDDKMQAGYHHEENGDVTACASAWLDAWADVLRLCDATGIGSIDEFDDRFSLTQSLFNWISDLEMELGNAGIKDPSFDTARIEICEEALRRFTGMDELMTGNLRRAWAESLFTIGRAADGNALFRSWLDADPAWGWGWIGWSDCHRDRKTCPGGQVDLERAEELLLVGFDQPGVRDRADIADRLAFLYEEAGRADEARGWRDRASQPGGGGRRKAVTTVVRSDGVVRNAPCPCGSGRKYKRCCGSPR
jgi:SEC-C motif